MSISKWLRQRIGWFALCAILFSAVAPAISQVLVSINDKNWIEVCSTYGNKRVALNVGIQKEAPDISSAMVHCAFCLLQNHVPIIPTSANLTVFNTIITEFLSKSITNTSPPERFIQRAYLTRAPPIFS